MPTNQWLQPILTAESPPVNWLKNVKNHYGPAFVRQCMTVINAQKKRSLE